MVYDAKLGNRIAIITDGIDEPGFDCVDKNGTLYVPQNGSIVEYAAGQTKPLTYITEGSGTPAACTVDANGNLWVAALSDVIEYLAGSTQPHKVIKTGVTSANSVVFDHQGNMYVGNNLGPVSQKPFISVYPPGRKAPSRTITDGVFYPEGLAVDAHDNLYIANFGFTEGSGCGDVAEYRAGQSKPFRKITDEISGPTGLAFAKGRLYEDNGGNAACSSNLYVALVLEFPLGSKRPVKNTVSIFRDPNGLAYYPPALPQPFQIQDRSVGWADQSGVYTPPNAPEPELAEYFSSIGATLPRPRHWGQISSSVSARGDVSQGEVVGFKNGVIVAFEIRIRLIIESKSPGLLDFVQVERALGLGAPETTWRIGDRFGYRSQRTRKTDGISYDFFRGRDCDAIEEASRLLQRLEAAGEAACSILREHSAELSIVSRIYIQDENEPMDHLGFHVSRAFIGALHRFHLELDVDQYVYSRESEPQLPILVMREEWKFTLQVVHRPLDTPPIARNRNWRSTSLVSAIH